jgi:hypothetical protein
MHGKVLLMHRKVLSIHGKMVLSEGTLPRSGCSRAMARQLWAIAGVFFILWGLTVVWVTAQQPILGHRGLNYLVFLSLFGARWWCLQGTGGTT